MMHARNRKFLVLLLVLGVVALVAQLAGVAGNRANSKARPSTLKLTTIPGGTVPDLGSTSLHKTSIRAAEGDVVRMRSSARVHATSFGADGTVQAVCGILYRRDGDVSWTLGTPYETVTLTKSSPQHDVVLTRSFDAPARDRYRAISACHVLAPDSGATVRASGSMRLMKGLPRGAARPA